MNRRPTLLAALALAATVTLAGCGSDDDSAKEGDKIAGAETSAEKSPTPSASASTSESEGRPKITFPSDAKNVFEGMKTGDPVKDAVLADNAKGINAVDEAIFKGSTDTAALGFYHKERALWSSIEFAQRYIDANDTWTGVTRYFDHKVRLESDTKAHVTYCSDESKAFIKSKKTGKVDRNPASSNSYVLYNAALTKNSEGIWQTSYIVSERGSEKCQP